MLLPILAVTLNLMSTEKCEKSQHEKCANYPPSPLWPRDRILVGARFSAPVKTQFPVQLVPGLFPVGKAAKVWHQPPTII